MVRSEGLPGDPATNKKTSSSAAFNQYSPVENHLEIYEKTTRGMDARDVNGYNLIRQHEPKLIKKYST